MSPQDWIWDLGDLHNRCRDLLTHDRGSQVWLYFYRGKKGYAQKYLICGICLLPGLEMWRSRGADEDRRYILQIISRGASFGAEMSKFISGTPHESVEGERIRSCGFG